MKEVVADHWPAFRLARELAGEVFPVSEAIILQTARKHGIGRKMGRAILFSESDCQKLYEVLPCHSNWSGDRTHQTGSSAAPSAESALKKALALVTAEEIRAKREAEILKASIYGRAATASFAEAALSYLEQGGSRKFLQPVIQYFKTTPLAKIDQDAIEEGAGKLFPNTSPATRNRNFYTPTLAVLNHAARKKLCARLIVKRPKPSKARVRWLTIEEADRLINATADHLRPLVIFLLYTGARVGEGLWLDWRNVDLERAHVTFTETKNGEARGVPLHQRIIAALANLPHRDGEVFRRPDGLAYVRSKGINDTSAGTRIKTAFRRAVVRAGLEDFHPHDCRHTWATWHYTKNRDLSALMKLGGWKSTAMVMRYAHANVAELSHTIDRLPGGKSGETYSKKEKIA